MGGLVLPDVAGAMASRQVRALLMGGQACVFYGAAEFSRDTDLLIIAWFTAGRMEPIQ